jgi:hypothetical protein
MRLVVLAPTLCTYPVLVTLACVCVKRRVGKSMFLRSAPPIVVQRTNAYLRLALAWKLALLALAPLVIASLYAPRVRLVALSLLFYGHSAEAMLRLRAFESLGVHLAIGPLERGTRAFARGVRRALARAYAASCTVSRSASRTNSANSTRVLPLERYRRATAARRHGGHAQSSRPGRRPVRRARGRALQAW